MNIRFGKKLEKSFKKVVEQVFKGENGDFRDFIWKVLKSSIRSYNSSLQCQLSLSQMTALLAIDLEL